MKKMVIMILVFTAGFITEKTAAQQDTVRYTGATLANVDYHHGQLSPAVGVHNIQVMRARRSDTSAEGGYGWTYNHQPMLSYWNNTFYLEYLSNKVGEHTGAGRTLLMTSRDGYNWTNPVIVFPVYKIPDGTVKEGRKDTAKNDYAVMHQRIGFFTSKTNHLLVLGFYGIVLGKKDDPNDGNGIGRVVREIYKDGILGPIYFLRYNHGFNEKNTTYPFFDSSPDKAFVDACRELLATPLMMQQMVEEADRNDPLIPLKKDFKAFNYYHLSDGRVVGLWKYALTSISKDEGKSWLYNPLRASGFVNANAKIWGQRTSDHKYATVYNPSEFRWPLAISISDDGLNYHNLLLVNGEITTLRYGGAFKSYGPQYVRGIQECDKMPDDQELWVTYSMNKEDIWISSIPVPVTDQPAPFADENFSLMKDGKELNNWNIYSPLWCKAGIEKMKNGTKALVLKDSDPFDFAKAERVIPASKQLNADMVIVPLQNSFGTFQIECQDTKGSPCLRLILDTAGNLLTKQGYHYKSVGKYNAGTPLEIKIQLNVSSRFYTITVNGKKSSPNLCFAPVDKVGRIVFRTGAIRRFPDADTPSDQDYDLPGAEIREKEAVYYIKSLKTY